MLLQMTFTAVVYPCLVIAYMGEAAYLTEHIEDLEKSFYKSIPGIKNCVLSEHLLIMNVIFGVYMQSIYFGRCLS